MENQGVILAALQKASGSWDVAARCNDGAEPSPWRQPMPWLSQHDLIEQQTRIPPHAMR
jgi:hypothetical protein